MHYQSASLREALAVRPGTVNLAGYDSGAMPLAPSTKSKVIKRALAGQTDLGGLQERLYAEAVAGGPRSVLLILQGLDTSGKGGVVKHVVGLLTPAGVRYTAFKKPTPEEAAHHFLWRVRKALPQPGIVGVFDRSHYEDVLVPRVHELIPEAEWQQRYGEINSFESDLVGRGVSVVKCFLHISYVRQRERLLARLDDTTKHWKFNEGDVDERARWSDYQTAYAAMLEQCSTEAAPWYVVPSDSKPYRNWAVSQILREVLTELNPQYPETHLEIERLRARLQPPY
jgi:PPK2 family polyphosphate:nucleotide phosphotransferase